MAKKKVEEKINLDSILFKCRDILRAARNSGSFFEKRDMMLTLVFLRFIGEKFEDGVEKLRNDLIAQGLDPDDPDIKVAFLDDPTFTDGTYNLLPEARWSTIINTPASHSRRTSWTSRECRCSFQKLRICSSCSRTTLACSPRSTATRSNSRFCSTKRRSTSVRFTKTSPPRS